MKPIARLTAIAITGALLGTVAVVGVPRETVQADAAASLPTMAASSSDSVAKGSKLKIIREWGVPVNMVGPSSARSYAAGSVTFTVTIPRGTIDHVFTHPDWKATIIGPTSYTVTNRKAFTVGGSETSFVVSQAFGAFVHPGTVSVTGNQATIAIRGDILPTLQEGEM